MIQSGGWEKYCIWEHSAHVKDLYAKRCRLEEPEMDAAAQAAELLAPKVKPGDTVLDAGCGSGYFYHSLKKRAVPADYFGIDGAPSLIEIGKKILPAHGLPAGNLKCMRLEDLDATVDHVVCLNVLSNIDNYHRPLERLLRAAKKTVILRESCDEKGSYQYVKDEFLDPGVDLKVHVNVYPVAEVTRFIESYGFAVTWVTDRRTQGKPENVIGYPHHWKFCVAERKGAK